MFATHVFQKSLHRVAAALVIMALTAPALAAADPANDGWIAPNTQPVPTCKRLIAGTGSTTHGTQISWQDPSSLAASCAATFVAVEQAALAHGAAGQPSLVVTVTLVTPEALAEQIPDLPPEDRSGAYRLRIGAGQVWLDACDRSGAINGLAVLEQRFATSAGQLAHVEIADWPDLATRGAQLVLRYITPEVAKAAIDRMRRGHYNLLTLSISNHVRFAALENLANNGAWSIAAFEEVLRHARESGMEVIPELRLLTHQKEFLATGAYPELLYNEKTYDPREPGVYDIVFPLIDEVVATMNPSAIHIGHDEVYGVGEGLADALPADLFLDDTLRLHAYLTTKGVQTIMAGDMLLTPAEFPEMHPGSLNGNAVYAALRSQLPKDIVICDWHYRQPPRGAPPVFPSMSTFIAEGFPVFGAGFQDPLVTDAFARHAVGMHHPRVRGMIATTWSLIRRGAQGPPNTDNWEAFDAILRDSAESFWNAGMSANVAPTIALTRPANGAAFTTGTAITINATAGDSDGTIAKVEFFRDTVLIGSDTTAPYSVAWNSATAGTYALTAKAYDDDAAVTTSGSRSITVSAAANQSPTVSLTSPADGASFTFASSITISATANDSDGTISTVEFFCDGILIGSDTTAPYSMVWNDAAVGSYALTAKAYDDDAAVATSAARSITVTAIIEPEPDPADISRNNDAKECGFGSGGSLALLAIAFFTLGRRRATYE